MGLTPLAGALNSVILACHKFEIGEGPETGIHVAISRYFHLISTALSTKTGEISTYSLAVRYPHSTKAVAALGKNLPTNTVEIHADQAGELGVKTGDLVIAERFSCLGFPSLRIQKVQVTWDNLSRYVIKVSGNSLVSQNLDFDGDVIFLWSFHTPEAKDCLEEHFKNPNPVIAKHIKSLNSRKVPQTKEMNLLNYQVQEFPPIVAESQAEMARKAVGVKAHTGPVIALCYDLMRIMEDAVPWEDTESRANVEMFLDKVGNSVFSQKHGTESMQSKCTKAICLADFKALTELGFPEKETKALCDIVKEQADKVGVVNLREHYQRHIDEGRSNIIKTIVRRLHKVYFATRANLHPIRLIEFLRTCQEPNDLVAHWLKSITWKQGLN